MTEFIQIFSCTIIQIHSNHKPLNNKEVETHLVLLLFTLWSLTDIAFFTHCKKIATGFAAMLALLRWSGKKPAVSPRHACGENEKWKSPTLSLLPTAHCAHLIKGSHSSYQKHSKLTFRCANFRTFFLHRCMYTTYFCLEDFLSLYNLFYNLLFHIICLGNLSLSEFMWC